MVPVAVLASLPGTSQGLGAQLLPGLSECQEEKGLWRVCSWPVPSDRTPLTPSSSSLPWSSEVRPVTYSTELLGTGHADFSSVCLVQSLAQMQAH